jgi:hypothetical protein
MKRFCLLMIIAVLFTNAAFAQDRDNRRPGTPPPRVEQPVPETVSVTGTLQLQNGFIVLVSGENVYNVPMLMRLSGFVDGIKEGKQVTVEGYGNRNMLHPTKLTVDGKTYDFPVRGPGPMMGQGFGYGRGQGPAPYGKGYNGRGGRSGWGGCCR